MRHVILALGLAALLPSYLPAETLGHTLARKISAMPAMHTRSTTHVVGTVGLVTYSKKDLRGSARGKHAVAAVSGAGDVVGVVLRPSGIPVCEFGGTFDVDSQCLTLTGCVTGTSCL
jgi:hypothetical protein